MLEQESYAWLAYCIIFGLISIVLFILSIFHHHIVPFALYAVILISGHIYITVTPYYTRSDIPWRDQEPILAQLPAFSILIFIGLVDRQFVYLKFIDTAFKNYKRWETLHPVVITDIKSDDSYSEKSTSTTCSSSIHEFEESEFTEILLSSSPPLKLLKLSTVYFYIVIIIFYALLTLAFLVCITVISDPQTLTLSSAICITMMFLISIFNLLAVIFAAIKCRSKELARMTEKTKKDGILFLLMPGLFSLVMCSTTALSWVAYTNDLTRKPLTDGPQDLTSWIVLKAFLVYLPLLFLFLCCMFGRLNSQTSTINGLFK